ATGDPHLANVLGQRFDLRKEGWHTLLRVPRGAKRGAALLSVDAEARQMGAACADMYFQSVNLTGRWVGSQGRAFSAGHVAEKESRRWLRYGQVELKVVQGHTKSGIVYLNFFVRNLKFAGYPVGGILGLDDHTAAQQPSALHLDKAEPPAAIATYVNATWEKQAAQSTLTVEYLIVGGGGNERRFFFDRLSEGIWRRSGCGGQFQATGDPHLANVLGQRFDLRKEGWHTLLRVPRGAKRGAALLSVDAEARQMGAACADMYFQSVNLTGRWVGSQGRAFSAGHVAEKESRRWLRYGQVELKVVQGHTKSGIVYLNFFVRNLKFAGYPVGGILGLDDHTAAAEPSLKCHKIISLLSIDGLGLGASPKNASTAVAYF
ncbi:unnamed protein product, partial [Prorocentrum cordatum]